MIVKDPRDFTMPDEDMLIMLSNPEEDEQVLAQVHTALKPHGYVILTVPQHAWLWSAVDEYACHVRRYSVTDLRRKFEYAGFSIVRTTSFVTVLLPPMAVSRMLKKKETSQTVDPMKELKLPPIVNTLFFWLLQVELGLIKLGIHFPVGGSRLVIARKV